MTTLYALAARRRALVAGTGNKIEDFGVGFYTKYGDGGVDLSPIADLVKTEVFALGHHLELPDAILSAPTDGLWGDDRTDEQQLGASYPELEWAMAHSADLAAGSASVELQPAGAGGSGHLPTAPPSEPPQDGPHPRLRHPRRHPLGRTPCTPYSDSVNVASTTSMRGELTDQTQSR